MHPRTSMHPSYLCPGPPPVADAGLFLLPPPAEQAAATPAATPAVTAAGDDNDGVVGFPGPCRPRPAKAAAVEGGGDDAILSPSLVRSLARLASSLPPRRCLGEPLKCTRLLSFPSRWRTAALLMSGW